MGGADDPISSRRERKLPATKLRETGARWLFAVAIALAHACGYASQYQPPRDGRARAIWQESDVVVELSGAPLSPACALELRSASATGKLRLAEGRVETLPARNSYWGPLFFGPPIVVVDSAIAPPLLRPPLFLPFAPGALGRVGAPVHGLARPVGGGLGDEGGKALVLVAVVALVVLPIVDVWLALDAPESERSPQAIDQVNAFNDLARLPGSPCSWDAPPDPGPS